MSNEFEDPTSLIFYSNVEELEVKDLAGSSAAIAVAMDFLKTRRKSISTLLATKIGTGDIGDLSSSVSDSGKSINVDIGSSIKLRRTESGGGRSIIRKKLDKLLSKNEIDPSKIIKPTGWKVDMDALEAAIEKHGIDRETVMIPTGAEVDDSVLTALVSLGHLEQEEVDALYEDLPPRVSVTCSFSKEDKELFLESLELGGDLGGRNA